MNSIRWRQAAAGTAAGLLCLLLVAAVAHTTRASDIPLPLRLTSLRRQQQQQQQQQQQRAVQQQQGGDEAAAGSKQRRLLQTTAEAATSAALCSATGKLVLPWSLYMQWQYGNVFTIPCGATLEFSWPYEPHGVVKLDEFKCPSYPPKTYAQQLAPLQISGGQVRNKGVATWKATKRGINYFACQVYGHCHSGQLIRVNVVASNKYKGPLLNKAVTAKRGCRQDTINWRC